MELTDFTHNDQTAKNFITLGGYDSIGNIIALPDNTFAIITGENYINPAIIEKAEEAGIDIRRLTGRTFDEVEEKWLKDRRHFIK